MACIPLPGGLGFVCTRGVRQACSTPGCTTSARFQCDAKLRTGKTCDRWLCDRCRVRIEQLDYCGVHGRAATASPTPPKPPKLAGAE